MNQKPASEDLRIIITDPNGAQRLVEVAESLGKKLKGKGLTSHQIRAIFGEVRQIQAEWSVNRDRAFRRLVLLKPKMKYRARKERGDAVKELVETLESALDYVIKAPPRSGKPPVDPNNRDDNFQRFVEFFEAILAYHKAYGGE